MRRQETHAARRRPTGSATGSRSSRTNSWRICTPTVQMRHENDVATAPPRPFASGRARDERLLDSIGLDDGALAALVDERFELRGVGELAREVGVGAELPGHQAPHHVARL